MPHATGVVNGDKTSSQFISRLSSYPAVNDGVETFKSNPYGKKSLELVDGAYARFGKPVEPYLETPYAYAKPYVQKADELADSGLGHVETHFPIVKEETGTIVETAKGYAFWPYNYLSSTWQDEYSKTAKYNNRGEGVSTSVLALISTELRIASDFFHAVANFLGPKYEETKAKGADYVKQLEGTANQYKNIGQDKLAEFQKLGQDKVAEYQKFANDKASEAQKVGEQKTDEAKKTAKEADQKAHHTAHEAHKKATK